MNIQAGSISAEVEQVALWRPTVSKQPPSPPGRVVESPMCATRKAREPQP